MGIVLVGASLTVGGVTLDSLLTTQDADRLLKVYYPTEGAAPRSIELATVRAIEARRSTAQALILPTGVASGACLLLGITALVIDGLTGQAMPSAVAVGLAPTRDGFTAGLHVSF